MKLDLKELRKLDAKHRKLEAESKKFTDAYYVAVHKEALRASKAKERLKAMYQRMLTKSYRADEVGREIYDKSRELRDKVREQYPDEPSENINKLMDEYVWEKLLRGE